MRKLLILSIILLLISSVSKASHVIGGDFHIQWVNATATGAEYHIKLRAYRDGNSGALGTTQAIGVYDAVTHAQVLTVTLNRTSNSMVPLGASDPCYDPDPNAVSIEENIFETSSNISLPNNANGYYIEGQLYARNALATNFPSANSSSMVWFAMIPDPALGPNSSPDFGAYPSDAYLCVNNTKNFTYPITDADGDSLAYSLVEPMDAYSTANGTGAGAGAYPFYPSLVWGAGYSLANIVGGTPPMTINPITGEISGTPAIQGFFTFAIRVEEFRNGVKIGEVRRDVQYASEPCDVDDAPVDVNNLNDSTIHIPINKEFCQDIVFIDDDATDTSYLSVSSPIFNLGAEEVILTPYQTNPDLYLYTYNNGNDSVLFPANEWVPEEDAYVNLGGIAYRFCWTPTCEDISEDPYNVVLKSFSIGCSGRTEDTVDYNLFVVRPEGELNVIPNVFSPNGDGMNDVYKLGGYLNPCTDEIKVEIYNRWGTRVYKSEELDFEWDGTNASGSELPGGTYFVIISGVYGEEVIEEERRIVTLMK